MKAFYVGRGGSLKIPKEYLIDYLVSEAYRCRKSYFTREQLEHEEKLEKLLVSYNLTVADAPDVSVDAILLGFQSTEIDMQRLLEDCSTQERQVLFRITATVKEFLRDTS